jgi:hypothetical protein
MVAQGKGKHMGAGGRHLAELTFLRRGSIGKKITRVFNNN